MKAKTIIVIVILSVVLGTAFTAIGAFCPVWLETYKDVYTMRFGIPFAFAEQTTDMVFNSDFFPRYLPPQYFHESFVTTFYPVPFVFSLIVNTVIAAAICLIIYFIHRSYRKKHPKKPRKKDEYIPVFD
jgi:hypothetical protein